MKIYLKFKFNENFNKLVKEKRKRTFIKNKHKIYLTKKQNKKRRLSAILIKKFFKLHKFVRNFKKYLKKI